MKKILPPYLNYFTARSVFYFTLFLIGILRLDFIYKNVDFIRKIYGNKLSFNLVNTVILFLVVVLYIEQKRRKSKYVINIETLNWLANIFLITILFFHVIYDLYDVIFRGSSVDLIVVIQISLNVLGDILYGITLLWKKKIIEKLKSLADGDKKVESQETVNEETVLIATDPLLRNLTKEEMENQWDELETKYEILNFATKSDLRKLKEFINILEVQKLLRVPWREVMRRVLVNPEIVYVIKAKFGGRILGFFIIYPLTLTCDRLIKEHKIFQSDDFKLQHICRKYGNARSVYLSWVFANGDEDKKIVCLSIEYTLQGILQKYNRIKVVYTRPVFTYWRDLAVEYGFKPLKNSESILVQTREALLKKIRFFSTSPSPR